MEKARTAPRHFRDEMKRALTFYTLIPIVIVIIAFFTFFVIYVRSGVLAVNERSNGQVSRSLTDMVQEYGEELGRIGREYPQKQLIEDEALRQSLVTKEMMFIDSMKNQADFYLLDEDYHVLASTADTVPEFLPPAAGVNWGIIRKMKETPGKINYDFISESTKKEAQKMLAIGMEKTSSQGDLLYYIYGIPRAYLMEQIVNQPVQIVVTNRYQDVCVSNTNRFTGAFGILKPEINSKTRFLPFNDDWYYVNQNLILDHRIHVYSFTPIKNALTLFILDLSIFLVVVTLIAYISVLGASRVAESKTAVIGEIIEAFEHVKQGSLDTPMKIHEEDELGVIEESYNRMLKSLKEQIERNTQITRETVLSEIKQLESQFDPHFLFNTLDTIHFMVKLEPDIASKMIISLSELLRYSINNQIADVTLREDLCHIDHYLTIQKFRYTNRLFTEINAQAETLDCIVPKLLLQPVIENSIKYGFRNQETLCIQIRTFITDRLHIAVVDDGFGMLPEKLDQMRSILKENKKDSGHFGLYNIHRRLKLMYGDEYGLQINSEIGRGTRISMTLPVRHKGGDLYAEGVDC